MVRRHQAAQRRLHTLQTSATAGPARPMFDPLQVEGERGTTLGSSTCTRGGGEIGLGLHLWVFCTKPLASTVGLRPLRVKIGRSAPILDFRSCPVSGHPRLKPKCPRGATSGHPMRRAKAQSFTCCEDWFEAATVNRK